MARLKNSRGYPVASMCPFVTTHRPSLWMNECQTKQIDELIRIKLASYLPSSDVKTYCSDWNTGPHLLERAMSDVCEPVFTGDQYVHFYFTI
jgi:hypothetical protein